VSGGLRPVGDVPDDYRPGELVRWLRRVDESLTALNDTVVVRAVYEVQRREQDNRITELALRHAEDRADWKARIDGEHAARERWQAGMVNRMWWLAGLAATLAIAVIGVIVSIVTK
jgi:hypothetical protein